MYSPGMGDDFGYIRDYTERQQARDHEVHKDAAEVMGLLAAGYLAESYSQHRRAGVAPTSGSVAHGAWQMAKHDLIRLPLFLVGFAAVCWLLNATGLFG